MKGLEARVLYLSHEELFMVFTKGITLSELCFRKLGQPVVYEVDSGRERDCRERTGNSFEVEQA